MKYIITGKLKVLYKKFLSSEPNPISTEIIDFLLQENAKIRKQLLTQELDYKRMLDKIKKG